MTVFKIAFDPTRIDPDSEAYPAFQAGGLTLKLWILIKTKFITNQHFREVLCKFDDYLEKAFDPDCEDVKPYTNIDEFWRVLMDYCDFRRTGLAHTNGIRQWLIDSWDYFNLNIQKSITLEYEAVETVTKKYEVTALRKGGE